MSPSYLLQQKRLCFYHSFLDNFHIFVTIHVYYLRSVSCLKSNIDTKFFPFFFFFGFPRGVRASLRASRLIPTRSGSLLLATRCCNYWDSNWGANPIEPQSPHLVVKFFPFGKATNTFKSYEGKYLLQLVISHINIEVSLLFFFK